MVEITAKEQNKGKRMKRIEDNSETSGTTLNAPTFRMIGVPEEEKKKGSEKIFEEITVENLLNMGKEIVTEVQEAQRVPYRINPRRKSPRNILIKLTKIKFKEKILKAATKKQKITYKGIPIRLSADFSAETLQARREGQDILKGMKEEKPTTKIALPSKNLIQI